MSCAMTLLSNIGAVLQYEMKPAKRLIVNAGRKNDYACILSFPYINLIKPLSVTFLDHTFFVIHLKMRQWGSAVLFSAIFEELLLLCSVFILSLQAEHTQLGMTSDFRQSKERNCKTQLMKAHAECHQLRSAHEQKR